MSKISAICFDAAGTLIEPAEPVATTYARIAADHELDIEADQLGARFRRVFPGMAPLAFAWEDMPSLDRQERSWWRHLVAEVFGPHASAHPRFDACFDELYAYYSIADAWRLYPEVVDVLQRIAAANVSMVVISNFDSRLFAILDGLGVSPFFQRVLASSKEGAAKPDSRIFFNALDVLGSPARATLHVGDNPVADVQGATDAGLKASLVARKRSHVPVEEARAADAQPPTIIEDLRPVASWVESASDR